MEAMANEWCGEFVTRDEAETEAVGEALGRKLREEGVPLALSLEGTLGVGKTCLVRGLVRGLGCPDPVSSPTFALVHEYRTGSLPIAHLDFYRLKNEEEIWALGWQELLQECVVAAEWGNRFPQVFPRGSLRLVFQEKEKTLRSILVSMVEAGKESGMP
jgi:tRNA threonylcarbamoyladenosine biosynthesis protein TsaE